MGIGLMLDWKWVFPIQSNFHSTSSTRQHSSSFRGTDLSFESTRASTLSFIPEENETQYKDSFKQYICSFGTLQSIENSYAVMDAMKMNDGKEEAHACSHDVLNSTRSMPILEDTSACVVGLPSNGTMHFRLLMENLSQIEAMIDNKDFIRLERDILLQIGRIGALKLFQTYLSRMVKTSDDPKLAFSSTMHSKDTILDLPTNKHMDSITVCSGKKKQRKSKRERTTEKAAKKSSLSLCSTTVNGVQQSLTKSSNRSSRRLAIARTEMEMARGVKEVTHLEKIRTSLEERIGQVASLTVWARAAGIDVKVLQHRLHFGWYCRDKLLKSTRSLVLYLARNYRGHGIGLEDLFQAGNMGVIQGAERFDHSRGYRFSTYVQYWIRKSMSSLIAQHSKGIKIPVTLNNVINQTKKARKALYRCNGRYPQEEEIAKVTGVSLANVRLANKCSKIMGSIDKKIGDCMGVKFKEITPDTTIKSPEEVVMKQNMRKDILDLLEGLHPREREVLGHRFGLGDGRRKSLEEIGQLFHVSKEWIRKIEKAALSKVREEEIKSRLKYYLEL